MVWYDLLCYAIMCYGMVWKIWYAMRFLYYAMRFLCYGTQGLCRKRYT